MKNKFSIKKPIYIILFALCFYLNAGYAWIDYGCALKIPNTQASENIVEGTNQNNKTVSATLGNKTLKQLKAGDSITIHNKTHIIKSVKNRNGYFYIETK